MFNHEIYATSFARAVHLLRDPNARREQQESALRALVALSELGSAALRVYGGLSVDDVSIPPEVPHLDELLQRMEAHGIAEVMLGKGAEPQEMLALLVALTSEPGGKTVKEHLRDVRSRKIMVILAPDPEESRRRPVSVSGAFRALDVKAPEEQVTLAQWEAMHARSAAMSMPEIDLGLASAAEMPGAAGTERVSQPSQEQPQVSGAESEQTQPASAEAPFDAVLTALARDPYGRQVLDRLSAVASQVNDALKEDRIADAVRALSTVVALESGAPEGTARNSYGIVLRRNLTRDVLAQIAPHALDHRLTEEVAVVMRRGRGEAGEILLGLLANAEGIKERRAYMQILRSMPQGIEQVVHMLDHHQWFVVRNVAELMGEARVEESVPRLVKLLSHRDQRVQRAAAVALAKIGTRGTVEPLQRTLREGSPELRSLIAMGIGRASRALAMPLVALAQEESDDDVRREFYLALGRIGTSDAVQALTTAAQPGGRLMGRKPSSQRVAAVEGLRLAGATAALVGLANDGDKAVREAVSRALRELKKGA